MSSKRRVVFLDARKLKRRDIATLRRQLPGHRAVVVNESSSWPVVIAAVIVLILLLVNFWLA